MTQRPVVDKSLAYAMGLFVVFVWGITVINTKILINQGLTANEILFYRTLLAWLSLFLIAPRPLFSRSLADEGRFLVLGLIGGTFYYLFVNFALTQTQTSSVSLLICTAPIWTILITMAVTHHWKWNVKLVGGTVLALLGVVCVMVTSVWVLNLSILGDLLTLFAALSWAVYCTVVRRSTHGYSTAFVTRKTLFYTIVTVLPTALVSPITTDYELLLDWKVLPQLMFLAFVAQTLCLTLWNDVVRSIGAVRSNNFLYLTPVVTIAVAGPVLGEKIALGVIAGCALIVAGVWLCDRGLHRIERVAKVDAGRKAQRDIAKEQAKQIAKEQKKSPV